ncbi:MAG TPA: SDR family NAD(P)-dependent oxidoreductase [Opitutaceae bacterium]
MEIERDAVVLVTGASAGIGEAIVRRLHRHGARIAFTGRRKERLQDLANDLDPGGGRVLPLAGDVTQAADRERWLAGVLERWGRIDALVNNAGYGQRGPIERVSVDLIRHNFETNVFSLVALTQLVIPHMRKRGGGRIIHIGSISGRIARPFSSIYDATKHALNALSDGMRGELRPFGIDVVVIEPGMILTEFVSAANDASSDFLGDPGLYASRMKAFERGFERVRRIAGKPDDIARLVERALFARRPRTRYAGPLHAKLALLLRWLSPDRVFDFLFRD